VSRKITTEQYISEAVAVHGTRYDYSKTNYTRSDNKVVVICKEHGEFTVLPRNHTSRRSGCPRCAGVALKTKEEVLEIFYCIYNGRYKYDMSEYRDIYSKIPITCSIHGTFYQDAAHHIHRKQGCPYCNSGAPKNAEIFIIDAVRKHGDTYDYSKVDYIDATTPVEIVCKIHGSFFQKPGVHLMPCGCPSCARSGFSPYKEGVVYVLESDFCVKVGISNKSGNYRSYFVSRSSGEVFNVVYEVALSGIDCQTIEREVLSWFRANYNNPEKEFDGYTECFVGTSVIEVVDKIQEEINKIYS